MFAEKRIFQRDGQLLWTLNRISPKRSRTHKPMNRIDVIQKIIDKTGAQNYLEIGVARGECFLSIKAQRKIAVDPKLRFLLKLKLKSQDAKYYQLTSDNFFAKVKLPHGFDIVFIDGLHTYQQSLKDVENALSVLNENGVIVMHDCNPPDAAAAHPANSPGHAASLGLPGWTGGWCGDVWKTVCHLRSQRMDLRIFTLDCDCGLGIVTKGKPENQLELAEVDLRKLTYDDLAKSRNQFLNLKDENSLSEFLQTI
jgi:SAM-dependent methyltransferase